MLRGRRIHHLHLDIAVRVHFKGWYPNRESSYKWEVEQSNEGDVRDPIHLHNCTAGAGHHDPTCRSMSFPHDGHMGVPCSNYTGDVPGLREDFYDGWTYPGAIGLLTFDDRPNQKGRGHVKDCAGKWSVKSRLFFDPSLFIDHKDPVDQVAIIRYDQVADPYGDADESKSFCQAVPTDKPENIIDEADRWPSRPIGGPRDYVLYDTEVGMKCYLSDSIAF